jgi:hypothetical protein
MSEDRELLEFVIKESYTPANLPMARLAEYLADLATILGEKDCVHFVELREGSASVVHAVEHAAIPKVRAHISRAQVKDADPEVAGAFERIDHRLRADNAFAILRPVSQPESRLLYFPGVSRPIDEEYGPFYEQSQLYGVPIAVGGKKNIVNVNLQDGEVVHYCEATRELALQIAPLMFNHHLRVLGIGRFVRDADARWVMKGFRISQFDKLDARPLAETVERLRAVTRRVGMDRDIIAKLAALREG